MTYYSEPIEKFLEDVRWRLFNAGHYRHADKMDEVLADIGKTEELEEIGGELYDAEKRIGELERALRAIQDCVDDNDSNDALADAIRNLVKEAL